MEKQLFDLPAEIEARRLFHASASYAEKIARLPQSLSEGRPGGSHRRTEGGRCAHEGNRPGRKAAPRTPPMSIRPGRWEYGDGLRRRPVTASPRRGLSRSDGLSVRQQQINFALVFADHRACLTVLMRYYTTPSVEEARNSVFWSIFFIALLYILRWPTPSSPSTRYSPIGRYPQAAGLGCRLDEGRPGFHRGHQRRRIPIRRTFLQPRDVSRFLATPEIAGMPFVVSGLVAAGGRRPCPPPTASCSPSPASCPRPLLSSSAPRPDPTPGWSSPKSFLLVVAVLAASVAAQSPVPSFTWWPGPFPSPDQPSSRPWCWESSGSGPTVPGRAACWPACSSLYYIPASNRPACPTVGSLVGEPMEAWLRHPVPIAAGAFEVPDRVRGHRYGQPT